MPYDKEERKKRRLHILKVVLAKQRPVYAKGGQGYYIRGKYNVQTSPRLKRFHSCIADQLKGKTFPNREAVREAFATAARQCAGRV